MQSSASPIFIDWATWDYSSPSYKFKSHLKKWSLKRGLPYLVGNQEVAPKALVPDYPPIRQTPFERPFFEVTLCGLS